MLDAYIIERIRQEREREQRDGAFIPLHIEPPRPEPPRPDSERAPVERDDDIDRGNIVIDFRL